MERKLIYIAIKTPDGTILPSLHRHDFKSCVDKNGIYYMIDGGPNSGYIRYSGNGKEEWIKVYADEPFEKVREFLHWGRNYNESGIRLRQTQWINLKNISQDHLETLTLYEKANDFYRVMFIQEKLYRAEQEYD